MKCQFALALWVLRYARHAAASLLRLAASAMLAGEVTAWGKRRNTHNAKWHFTSADARVKLKSLYPAL
jgi:hypothetical protein